MTGSMGWGNVFGGKQVWEMTLAEFRAHPHTKKLLKPSTHSIYSGLRGPSRAARRVHYSQVTGDWHRLDVMDATAAGQNVPAEVLADYPALLAGRKTE